MPPAAPRASWPLVTVAGLALAALVACAAPQGAQVAPPSAGGSPAKPSTGGGATTPPPAGGGTTVSFKGEVGPILKASCAGCHGPSGSARPTFLAADGEAVHGASASNIARLVASVESGRMPKAGAKLTAAQIATLKAWQAAGSPDN
ncbi:MAG: c-type cytochrome [Candidatus Sericytochromatia bacterium]|nr:c-type cytochrome [Candidatus Sericytochromatia bacterium]